MKSVNVKFAGRTDSTGGICFALKSLPAKAREGLLLFEMDMNSKSITDVQGIRIGHQTNVEAATGCTVVLCEDGAVGGVGRSRLGAGNSGDGPAPTYNARQ